MSDPSEFQEPDLDDQESFDNEQEGRTDGDEAADVVTADAIAVTVEDAPVQLMSAIDLGELQVAVEGLKKLESGYKTLLASPDGVDNIELQTELKEELEYTQARLKEANNHLISGIALLEGGYPTYRLGHASQAIIDAIKALSDAVALVPLDFKEPEILTDSLSVSVT